MSATALSEAPLSIVEEVALFFEIGLGRPPAPGGLTFWTNARLQPGFSSKRLAEEVFEVPEFETKFGPPGTLSDRAFVEAMYRNVLKREGAPGGVDFWTGRLKGDGDKPPLSRAEILMAFARSDENRTKVPELDRLAFDPVADDGNGQWLFDPDPMLGEALSGTAGDDYLRGLGGDDTLAGGAGDDELFPGPGEDRVDGGAGADTAIYERARDGVRVEVAPGLADGVRLTLPGGETDSLARVETLRFVSRTPDADGAFVEIVALADLLPPGTPVTGPGTLTATPGPDIFTLEIDSSTGVMIGQGFEGLVEITNFDPDADRLRFVETGGGTAREDDILSERGIDVLENPFDVSVTFVLGDNPDFAGQDGAQIRLDGIETQSAEFLELI